MKRSKTSTRTMRQRGTSALKDKGTSRYALKKRAGNQKYGGNS